MRRRLNVKFLAFLLVALVLGGGGVHLVHGFQEGHTASALLGRGRQAERRGDLEEAATYTARYLALRPEDDEALGDYALLLDRRAATPRDRMIAYPVMERALARSPGRSDLRRKVIALAMSAEVRRYRDARGHILTLLKASPNDGELEGQLARCLEAFASGEDTDASLAGGPKAAYEEAARWYAASLEHAPGRVASYVRLANLLRGPLKDPGRADRIIEARGANPDGSGLIARNPNSAEAHLARAEYRRGHGIDGVDEDIAQALALSPDDADVLLAAAATADANGRPDEARSRLAKGIQDHPKDPRMYLALASLEIQSGRPEEAAACLRSGLETLPGQELLQWTLADTLIRSGGLDEASRLVETLRQRTDISGSVVDVLAARILLEKGNLAEGVRILNLARATMPGSGVQQEIAIQADLLLAVAYARLDDPDRQAAACRRALAVDPKSAPARISLASALLAQGRFDEAIAAYREAIPVAASARIALANLLVSRNLRLPADRHDWDEVKSLLDEADRSTPGSDEVAILRAQVLLARGKANEARDRLVQARDLHPEQASPWIALAALAGAGGKMADVMAVLDEARGRLGDRADLRLARIGFLAQGQRDEARPALDGLSRDLDQFAVPDRVTLEQALAEAYSRIGDPDASARHWAKVLEERPNNLRAAMTLFDFALRPDTGDGRPDAIRRAVDRIRRIEGEDGTIWRHAEAVRLIDSGRRGDRKELGKARVLLGEIQARRQNWSVASLLEAELDELEGFPDQALVAYQKAIQQGEARPATVRRTVQLLKGRGREAEADRLVSRLVEQAPPSGDLARMAAEMALRQDDQQRAVEFAHQAVRADSTDPGDHLWLGRALQSSGRTAEAEAELRKSIAIAPAKPEARVTLVRLLARDGRKAQAEAAIAEAKVALPVDVAPTALASCFEAIGRPDQAEQEYRSALEAGSAKPALRLAFAEFLLRAGRPQDAEAVLRPTLESGFVATPRELAFARRDLALCLGTGGTARLPEALALIGKNLEADPESIQDRRIRAILLQMKPAYRREAIRSFEDLARQAPPSPSERFLLAHLYSSGEEWPKARDILQSLLASEPENPAYLSLLARVLLDHGRGAEAEGLVARLEEISPGTFTTVELKARLLQEQGQGDRAIAALEALAKPDTPDLRPIAAALEKIGQPAAAEAMFRRYVDLTKRPVAVFDLALFLGRQGRLDAALDLCEQARATCPPADFSAFCLQILGTYDPGAGRIQRVGNWLREGLKKEPDNPSMLFDLSNLEVMNGHYDEADALLRRVIAKMPQLSGPINNLAWLLAARGVRPDEALGLVNRAIAIEGPEPDLLDTRSLIYLAQGRADRAVVDLQEVAATNPTAIAYFHLARAFLDAGNRQASQETMLKAKSAGLDERAVHPIERPKYRQLVTELARK